MMVTSFISTLHDNGVSPVDVSNRVLRNPSRTRQQPVSNDARRAPSRRIALPPPLDLTKHASVLEDVSRGAAVKCFSTAASIPAVETSDTSKRKTGDADSDKEKPKKESNSNLFLDNLGKIFLASIGLVLALLLRSTKSNNARTALRDAVETAAALDPLEIEHLRLANSEFTIEVWGDVMEEIRRRFAGRGGRATYPEFLSAVLRALREKKGEHFTIECGHLLDRVVIAELTRRDEETRGEDNFAGVGGGDDSLSRKELSLPFLLVSLSLALNSTVTDRVRALFESMLVGESTEATPVDETTTVPGDQVFQMIQHLQNTCQLVPAAQIVETNATLPFQTFRVGTGEELTRRARGGQGGKKGGTGVTEERDGPVLLEEFHAILKSGTVCAWGECHVKRASRTATSDRQT